MVGPLAFAAVFQRIRAGPWPFVGHHNGSWVGWRFRRLKTSRAPEGEMVIDGGADFPCRTAIAFLSECPEGTVALVADAGVQVPLEQLATLRILVLGEFA